MDGANSTVHAGGTSFRDIIQYINEEIREGLVEPVEKDGHVIFELTSDGLQEARSTLESLEPQLDENNIQSLDCNGVTKTTDDGGYFDSEDTAEVASAVRSASYAAGLAGTIAVVFGGPIGAFGGIIMGIAAFLLHDFSGDLDGHNFGCGVKVEEYNFVGWDVRTQGRPPCDC